ncbi:MAG: acyl-CoA thioesterase domain-containing protein [Nocardioides sp.]
MDLSFFVRDGDALAPTELARGSWSRDSIHGVALCGALGRAAERTVDRLGRDDLRPARLTVDLFAAPRFEPCVLASEVVREGPRICLVDVQLTQAGKRVARAGVLFLKATGSAPGAVWSPEHGPILPPLDVVPPSDQPRVPFVQSDSEWSQDFREHQNSGRKTTWNSAVAVVAGEPLTPFQAAAATADGVNLVTNWGSNGVEHINTDVTLALARAPIGTEIGLAAVDRVEQDGIAVGTATVFDRSGPLGTVMCTVIANAQRTVDMGGKKYEDDPRSA